MCEGVKLLWKQKKFVNLIFIGAKNIIAFQIKNEFVFSFQRPTRNKCLATHSYLTFPAFDFRQETALKHSPQN